MKSKGFTLIELLAVIVILAIIALIATPIILNIINDSKEESDQRSVELYAEAVKNAAAQYQLKEKNENVSGSFTQSNNGKTLTRGQTILTVDYDGDVICETIKINEDGTVYLAGCTVNGEKVKIQYGEKEPIAVPVTEKTKTTGNVPKGKFEAGDEYIVNVDGTNKYHFFVLSTNKDETINLILDRNICENGSLTTTENQCKYGWVEQMDYGLSTQGGYEYGQNGSNLNGPITLMNVISNATSGWTNIPNISINYTNSLSTDTSGYEGISTIGTTTILTRNKNTSSLSTLEMAKYENLKARVVTREEANNVNCLNNNIGTCPLWMVNYLYDKDNDAYEGRTHFDSTSGYWTLSSDVTTQTKAYYISCDGGTYLNNIFFYVLELRGVRPVITLSPSDMS